MKELLKYVAVIVGIALVATLIMTAPLLEAGYMKKIKTIKAFAVIHEDYPEDLRYWGGQCLIEQRREYLEKCVSKKRGGTGEAINESLVIVPIVITFSLAPTPIKKP